MRLVSTVVVAVALGSNGCGGTLGPDSPVSGDWTGTGSGINLTVTLSEGGNGSVSGNGTISGAGPTVPVTVSGSHTSTGILLSIKPVGFQALTFTGTISSDGSRMSGEVNRSGFTKETFTMRRV